MPTLEWLLKKVKVDKGEDFSKLGGEKNVDDEVPKTVAGRSVDVVSSV